MTGVDEKLGHPQPVEQRAAAMRAGSHSSTRSATIGAGTDSSAAFRLRRLPDLSMFPLVDRRRPSPDPRDDASART